MDGQRFLDRGLPFNMYDFTVIGLEPCLGPLTECTEVRIKTIGLVRTEIQKVRIDFPRHLNWPSRQMPGNYDHTSGEIVFSMPELSSEVRRGIDNASAQAKRFQSLTTPVAAIDVNGGLAGLEVFVELSLNGQNFTEDRVHFTYHGASKPLSAPML